MLYIQNIQICAFRLLIKKIKLVHVIFVFYSFVSVKCALATNVKHELHWQHLIFHDFDSFSNSPQNLVTSIFDCSTAFEPIILKALQKYTSRFVKRRFMMAGCRYFGTSNIAVYELGEVEGPH